MSRHQVIVIGAGIVGICAALAAQRRGLKVCVVDRLPPGEACSFGNAGVLAAWGCVPMPTPETLLETPKWLFNTNGPLTIRWRYLPKFIPWLAKFALSARPAQINRAADIMFALNNSTVEHYQRLAKEAGVPELIVESNYLHVFRSEQEIDLNNRGYSMRRDRGAQITVLKHGEIREVEPDLSTDYKAALLIGPQGHTVNPNRLVTSLASLFQQGGGQILQADVRKLVARADDAVDVITESEALVADKVVVAAGAWSHRLLDPLGVRIPLEAERGYHVRFANSGVTLSNTILESENYVVANAMEDGLRLAGTVEFAGLDTPPDWSRAEMLKPVARAMFPDADLSSPEMWQGPRPALPDDLPVIGPIDGAPNVIAAFGHGHLGLTGAPGTAEIVSGFLAGETPNVDLGAASPGRFM